MFKVNVNTSAVLTDVEINKLAIAEMNTLATTEMNKLILTLTLTF